MSCLFAIGLHQTGRLAAVQSRLKELGFLPSNDVTHDYAQRVTSVGEGLSPNTIWFLATDVDESPDFSIAYDLPGALAGRLGTVLQEVLEQPGAFEIEILIYDLGTNNVQKYDRLPLEQIERMLRDWYSIGAPTCTVYHKFVRD
jgi:hypothetical protein